MILHDYETSSGRNVIKEYIDSLTIPEMVDGYSDARPPTTNAESMTSRQLCTTFLFDLFIFLLLFLPKIRCS